MIAQPTSQPTTSPLVELQQDVLLLRATLDDALRRLGNLEQRLSQADLVEHASARPLLPQDSPEMAFAIKLCQDVFPGCTVDVAVQADPSEPDWNWHLLTIHWRGEIRDAVDREMIWHAKLRADLPHILDQFRLFVDVQ